MNAFQQLMSLDEIEDFIEANTLAFLYFTTPSCSVCHGLKPQIKEMLQQFPQIHVAEVDVSEVREAAGRFTIFAAPVLLLFYDGKEFIREARIVNTAQLHDNILNIYENVVG